MDMNLLLGLPVEVKLKEGTYNKSKFKGLFVKRYKLKDFLNKEIGYDKYMSWCATIVLKPKDFADQLWVKYNAYYKEVDDWLFLMRQCLQPDESGVVENSLVLEGLKFMFDCDFCPRVNIKGETSETRYFFDIYDKKNNWLATIDKDNFESIRQTIRKINHIQPSELSTWNYAHSRHEKIALKYYYEKHHDLDKPKEKYIQNLETIMRFLKTETNRSYAEMMEESLYEIYKSYTMKVDTLIALAINTGIYTISTYAGALKSSEGKYRTKFGIEHNVSEQEIDNLADKAKNNTTKNN